MADDSGGFLSMKRIISAFAIIFLIVAVGLFIARLRWSTRSFDDLNQEMQYRVSELVEKDKSVRSCVLSVMRGDGSFSWSGAAGVARQDGQVLMTTDTPFYLASITKLYTATVIMQFYEKGELSLDDPMSKYLPQELIQGIHVYHGKDYSREITIQHLLSHMSGIADYYTEKPEGGKTNFELFLEEPERLWTVEATIERVRNDLEPKFPPGTGASYSDTNFQLLGKILEAISGKPLHVLFEEYIFRSLELRHTWLVGRSEPQSSPLAAPADVFCHERNITTIRSNGSYWADGGLVSTVDDIILFLKALNEGRIIRRDTLKLMHNWHKLEFPMQYGYGTMYFKFPWFMKTLINVPPVWGHSGSTGSFLYYFENLDLYMAGTINQTESKLTPFRLMGRVIKAIRSKRSEEANHVTHAKRSNM